jgi:hypothetical protein
LAQGLSEYSELDVSSWYHNQKQAMKTVEAPWTTVFHKVLQHAGADFRLMRYALTGQTSHQQQFLHRDTSLQLQGKFVSYLLYLNDKWDQSYGGTTDFVVDDQLVHQEIPEPGKLVEFNSQMLHVGNPPTVANVLRLTLVIHGQLF